MKLSKQEKYIKTIIIVLFIIFMGIIIFDNNQNNKKNTSIPSYIKLVDAGKISFKEKNIVLTKIDLTVEQKTLLDIDNNKEINNNDLQIFKDIINNNIKDLNNDNIMDKKDLDLLKKYVFHNKKDQKYDLNYDKEINDIDINLLQRYISNVIDLDINRDGVVDYEDVNILELYLLSNYQLEVLLPKTMKDTKLNFNAKDNDIITIDNNGKISSLNEGTTTITVKDKENNTDECEVIVIDYNTKENKLKLDKNIIYLSATSMTTVEKSLSDISKNNIIDTYDLQMLKEMIRLEFGDINKDKIADKRDLKIIDDIIKGKNHDNNEYSMADINKDGYINNIDYNILKNYVGGKRIGDINKDNQTENRDIKIISKYIKSYYRLTPTFEPNNITNKQIVYKSSDTGIVSVDRDGVIYAHKDGEATITAISHNRQIASCKVIVSENNQVPYSVENNLKSLNLKYFNQNKYRILNIDFNMDGFINKTDQAIATKLLHIDKDNNIIVEVLNFINQKIYKEEYDLDNNKILDYQDYFILYNYIKDIKTGDINNDNQLTNEDISLIDDYINSKAKISTDVKDDKSINSVAYMSKNANIATIDKSGIITAKKRGKTEIVATTVNGLSSVTEVIVE